MTSFNMDEQIFLKNDKTNKVYTLTLNKIEKTYDITREWTVPGQSVLASKTDKFPLFKQAAELMEHLYNDRIKNGYVEVMRRQNVKKRSPQINKHSGLETNKDYIPVDEKTTVTGVQPGQYLQNIIQSRHRTTIHDRIGVLNRKK